MGWGGGDLIPARKIKFWRQRVNIHVSHAYMITGLITEKYDFSFAFLDISLLCVVFILYIYIYI